MKKNGFKIGITGGIGSGKSVLSDFIRSKGYKVIDADSVGKELLASDNFVREKIIKNFGVQSFNGKVPNRKFLASQVFNDQEKLKIINSIIHPPVMKKISALMAEELKSKKLVFAESAIIYEADLEDYFDYVILVAAEAEIRIERLKKNKNMEREEILRRMENQLTDDEKKENADFTILNNTSEEDLFHKAAFILNLLESMLPE